MDLSYVDFASSGVSVEIIAMKVAIVQKSLVAVAVSLVFVLAGFTSGLAHGTASAGLVVAIQLHQVFAGGNVQLDHQNTRFGFGSNSCALPTANQSPVQAAWLRIAHSVFSIRGRPVTPKQDCTARFCLFDTVLLI